MAYLVPDKTYNANGVTIKEYLLTNHNINRIDMPWANLPEKPIGITVHNTDSITTGSGTTMSEQYTRATVNGNMGDVRVHFYCDDVEAWQNLPFTLSGWHAADGQGDGNRKTIAIECIMNGTSGTRNEKAEDNCARLTAWLLNKYGLTTANVYSHSHWYSGKTCPIYILPHWNSFIKKVEGYLKSVPASTPTPAPQTTSVIYRIRKTWDDAKSQYGAYANLDSAKKMCPEGYSVFDPNGKVVYSNIPEKKVSVELRQLQKGSNGNDVKSLQQLLIARGYNLGSYGSDGSFGDATLAAVKKYQSDNKLTSDGIVGKTTWESLFK